MCLFCLLSDGLLDTQRITVSSGHNMGPRLRANFKIDKPRHPFTTPMTAIQSCSKAACYTLMAGMMQKEAHPHTCSQNAPWVCSPALTKTVNSLFHRLSTSQTQNPKSVLNRHPSHILPPSRPVKKGLTRRSLPFQTRRHIVKHRKRITLAIHSHNLFDALLV